MEQELDERRDTASQYAMGFAGLIAMGQLGQAPANLVYGMTKQLRDYPDELERVIPGVTADDLEQMYDSEVESIVARQAEEQSRPTRMQRAENQYEMLAQATGIPVARVRMLLTVPSYTRQDVEDRAYLHRV